MTGFNRIFALVRGNLALVARDPGPLLGRIVQPVLLMLLLYPLYMAAMHDHRQGSDQAVLGQLVMFSLLATSLIGSSILTERRWQTFDRLRASPARAIELVTGKAVPAVLILLIQQSVVLGIGVAVLKLRVRDYGLLAIADAVWAITIVCLGAAVAMTVRSLAQFGATVDIGATILTGIGGALVPLTAMPAPARAAAPASPGYWAMSALHGALHGDARETLTAAAVLLLVAVAAATMAAYKLTRGWGRATLL